jgi:Pyridoxamine 5'-phosphate oxidase
MSIIKTKARISFGSRHKTMKSSSGSLLVGSLCLWLCFSSVQADDPMVACPCEIAPIPDLRQKELTARWMVHSLNWGVLSTISSRLDGNEEGMIPFGNVYSYSDGPCLNSTGVPYFYGTYMDQSFKDSLLNANAALTLSEASLSSVCMDATTTNNNEMKRSACQIGSKYGDPENPVCARLTLTGKLVEVTDPVEKEFSLQSIFSRHASMTAWPEDHEWIVAKLELSDIWLIDFFGGASILDLDAYFGANDFLKELLDKSSAQEEENKN